MPESIEEIRKQFQEASARLWEAEQRKRDELRSNPPQPLLTPDFTKVVECCKKYISQIASGQVILEYQFFDDIIEIIYGETALTWKSSLHE